MKLSENCTGLNHLGLPTENIEKTIEFYGKIGFSVAWRTEDGKVAFLKMGDLVIETYEREETAGKPSAWDHVCIGVENVEDAFATAKAEGYDIIDADIRFLPFWGNGVRFFNVLGPSGETVEFLQML